jgi:hypothetical protein
LDIILYSREQLLQEYAAMPSKTGGDAVDPEQLLPNVPWGIISIKVRSLLLVGGCNKYGGIMRAVCWQLQQYTCSDAAAQTAACVNWLVSQSRSR